MKGIRKFDEFVKGNIAKQQSIDGPRAEFLVKEAEKELLQSTGDDREAQLK